MKTTLFILLFCAFGITQAQSTDTTDQLNIGDTFQIAKISEGTYQHIHMPKANTIRKRGGLPNYEALEGVKVAVVKLKTNPNGETLIVLQRADGGRFFGSHTYLKANAKALEVGELITASTP